MICLARGHNTASPGTGESFTRNIVSSLLNSGGGGGNASYTSSELSANCVILFQNNTPPPPNNLTNLRPLVKSMYQKKKNSYFSTNTYVVGNQKNHLHEMVLLSAQNIC